MIFAGEEDWSASSIARPDALTASLAQAQRNERAVPEEYDKRRDTMQREQEDAPQSSAELAKVESDAVEALGMA